MKTPYAATIAFALCAAPALADDDPMKGFYGNTIVSTDGITEIHTHYRADHTWDMTARSAHLSASWHGTWKIDAKGDLCRSFDGLVPPGAPNPLCKELVPHKVGDSWTVELNGDKRHDVLKPGSF